MRKATPYHPYPSRTRPSYYRRPAPASSSPSQTLNDPYYVGPGPGPRHERRGESPMMLPDEEAVSKEAALLFRKDLPPFNLEELYESLQNYNKSGSMVTYCYPSIQGPVTEFKFLTPPLRSPLYCPHISNSFHLRADCEMEIYRDTTLGRGKERWTAHARRHNCKFMVDIPRLDDLKKVILNNSVSGAVSTPSSQTSTSNSSMGLPPSSAPSTPSSLRTWNTASSSRPTISPRPPRLDNFYNSDEILERSDLALNTNLMSNAMRLSRHPANNRECPPAALYHYHPISCPGPFKELGFANSMIGMAMKYFNSPEGISPAAHHLAFLASTLCTGCRNQFSIDGFREHIAPEGRCSNPKFPNALFYPPAPIHPAADRNNPPRELLQFHPSSNPSPPRRPLRTP
ncbi:hypothetical protein FIBSPDRAFT_962623 [Athelia psychrophila]|uniref:Uncharacterized protein n=1 Tax=Athelia psychrophila TaxID=1759441 RepID=A0A165ZYK7_9AGAM|nr:hypothetical protein FIBSPDRAFT_962623 [Fibularhizoctonia sp. CBS 109695]